MLHSGNDGDSACISFTLQIRRYAKTHLRQRMIEDMGIRNLAYNPRACVTVLTKTN